MRWRALALVLLVVFGALALAAVVFRSWVAAQANVVVVLSRIDDTPVLSWAVGVVTGEPRVEERTVAAAPTTLLRPEGDGPWPAVVVVNGATELGRHDPDLVRFAHALARAGFLVVVPDLPGLRRGEITEGTVRATTSVAAASAASADARGGQVAFVGVSVGGSLALLAAERPELAGRVRAVAAVAPYGDLLEVIRLATTGVYAEGRRLHGFSADPFLALAVARSVVAGMPSGRDRRRLLTELLAVPDDDPDPLAVLRRPHRRLGRAGRAVLGLLANADPLEFHRRVAALPATMRDRIRRLSPISAAARLHVRVELATSPRDAYFPVAESERIARRAPNAQLTVTSTLTHVLPEPSFRSLGDLLRFDGFAVRVLRYMRSGA